MPNSLDYRRISQTLKYSRDHFEEAEALFSSEESSRTGGSFPAEASSSVQGSGESGAVLLQQLKERWQKTLAEGTELADWVVRHHRTQSPPVYAALGELAKYADVRRPFRLSVIGQKGVGKSALVNALLGATDAQYTPSEVAGKAVSGTRIRLLARPAGPDSAALPAWRVVFLTPGRLWEVGQFLLTVARLEIPRRPADLERREEVLETLGRSLEQARTQAGNGGHFRGADELPPGSATQIQAANARRTLERMLEVYRRQAPLMPEDYRLDLDETEVDGPVSPYIRQGDSDLYLIVDYVERYLEPDQAGLLAGRRIELEDVLGLDDPRDSFFALEAFRESFAVIMVFKCDRGLNTESSSILQRLFSRDEGELARFGDAADLNKAIIVANQFDAVLANVAADSRQAGGSPLRGLEDIRREMSNYTRQPVPLYLTSAAVAQTAQGLLESRPPASEGQASRRTTPAYNFYLEGLANLLHSLEGRPAPDYLDFIYDRQAEIDTYSRTAAGLDREQEPGQRPLPATVSKDEQQASARLILELSGLPRLAAKVREALESGSILRGRVANAEYYYSRVAGETALCYARQLQAYKLTPGEFALPPVNQESRLFLKFQHETRRQLEALEEELRREWFEVSRRYIYGPHTGEVEQVRQRFMETISRVVQENRQLIQLEQHISTGQLVTDAWRKVFEDINDWLALEAGRQLRALVGPALMDIERLAGELQKQLAKLAAFPLDDSFWANYRRRLAALGQRLQDQAETLGLAYYTAHRFSVYDVKVAETLHVGDAYRRREEVSRLLQEKVLGWFNDMHQHLAKIAMTNLNAFVSDLRYSVLGLPASNSLLVGLELARPGSGQLPPDDSLISLLNLRYQTDEAFRRQYALREPTPAERLVLEIRAWLALIQPPLEGLAELNKAFTIAEASRPQPTALAAGEQPGSGPSTKRQPSDELNSDKTQPGPDGEPAAGNGPSTWPPVGDARQANQPKQAPGRRMHRLQIPIETRHPFPPTARQFWELTNPDEGAAATRLHFSRIELGNEDNARAGTGSNVRLILEALGRKQTQVITGQHTDFWSQPFPGRLVTVRFLADNAQPAWGFVLDGFESVMPAEAGTTAQ